MRTVTSSSAAGAPPPRRAGTGRRGGAAGLAAVMALGTVPALTALGTSAHGAVSVGENISVFPDRDMVVAVGYNPGEQLLVEALRNDVVIGSTQGPAASTPEGVGLEVNHGPLGTAQPGDCWNDFTPNIVGGDVIRVTAVDRPGAPSDTMTVRDLAFTGDPFVDGDNVSIRGTATPTLSFAVEFRRDKPDPRFRRGPFVPVFDTTTPDPNDWKATFRVSTTTSDEGLTPQQQRDIALNQASWLAVADQISETTLAEHGEAGGVAAGCPGSADPNTLVGGLTPINAASVTPTAPARTFSGTARAGVTSVSVTVGSLAAQEATLTVDPTGGPSTWTLTVPAADLAGLPDGTVAVTPTFGTLPGVTKNVLKDTSLPVAPTPSVTPGPYSTTQAVALNKPAGEETSKVYWEIGNTTVPDPTAASNLYTTQIQVTSTQTITGRIIDAAGNLGTVGRFTYQIGNPPPAPTSLTGAESTTAAGAARLQWTAATGAAGYNVYRDGLKVNTAVLTTLSFTDTSAGVGVHSYTVRAVETNGIESLDSNRVTVTIAAPEVPTGLQATPGDTRVVLSWTAVTGATRYRIFRDGVALPTLAGTTTYTDTGLVNGSLYAYEITALDAGGNESAHSGAVQATPVGDTVAPTVTTRAPASGGTAVAVTGNVTATFSEPVQGVSGTTFTLRTGTTTGTGTTVTGAVTYNATTRVATLNPGANLAANTTYTATLTGSSTAIRDTAATPNALVTTAWQFTTGSTNPPPTVTGRSPASGATGVSSTANVTATFSEAVQGVSSTTVRLRPTAGSTTVGASVTYNATTRVATLDPTASLAAGTTYTVTLTGGSTAIRDTTNVALATTSWTFTTSGAPTVLTRSPASGATGVLRGNNVSLRFSQDVVGVSTSTVTLTKVSTGARVTSTVTYNGSPTFGVVLNPGVTLDANSQYRVTVVGGTSAIRTPQGVPLATTSWTFTTGAS